MAYARYNAWEDEPGITFSDGFWEGLQIKKARKEFPCPNCGKKYNSGTRYVAESRKYSKICLFCLNDWIKNSQDTMSLVKGKLTDLEKDLKNNKDKYLKEAMAAKIRKVGEERYEKIKN